jgi:aryl-alcohol dehydrogenase-like predicted oxidoreductase
LLNRWYEDGLAEIAHRDDVGLLAYSPLAMGVLSGKYLPGAAPLADSRANSDDAHYMQRFLAQPVLEAVQRLKPLADKAGCSLAQLAIAWVIAQPGITSAIIGASRPEQIRETAKAADLAIDPALLAEAAAILEGVRNS